MADIFIVRERLKFTTKLMVALTLLCGLATWYFWKQLEFETDQSRFLFSAVLTGASALGTLGVVLFYLTAQLVVNPSRGMTDRIDTIPWWVVRILLMLAVIGVSGYFIYRYSDHAESEFDLLQAADFQTLEERLQARPELLTETNDDEWTLLQAAYRNNQPEAVELLLSLNSPAENLDPSGRNPVIASLDNLPMLTVLLNGGFDPEVYDPDGVPALHLAAALGSTQVVAQLLRSGAEVDARDRLYRTALMREVELGDVSMAESLINYGADVNAFDQRGDTALHIAVRRKNIEGLRLLVDHGADGGVFNFIHLTPLHLAAQGGYTHMVGTLAEHLDSVDLVDEVGRTPLEKALENRQYKAAEVLLAHGADLNRIESDGSTLLHRMVNTRDYGTARFLIRAGAQTDIPDRDGRTVRSICEAKELQGLVDFIESQADAADDPAPEN